MELTSLFHRETDGEDRPVEDELADLEILKSWYGCNSDRVNCVEMSGGGTPEEELRVLREYVGEFRPNEAERVWRV